MKITYRTIALRKRFPLAISRGVSGGSENLFVSVAGGGVVGWGEMAPGVGQGAATAAAGRAALEAFCGDAFGDLDEAGALPAALPTHALARVRAVPACALAALDMALWDHLARRAGLPLYQLLGLGRGRALTSVTIGINPPDEVRRRVPLLLAGGARALKIKLGSPEGADADREMFAQVVECTRGLGVATRVDANGGWDVPTAQAMMKWLAARGAEYVEQPLAVGCEAELPALYHRRPLPIFADESCRYADDVPALAAAVDGVNLKLMKCGGVTGALQIMAAARAHGLQTMVGCMSESSLAIAAAAALAGGIDYIDLDSHLNLDPDPCTGAPLVDGVITPTDSPGHGGRITDTETANAE